jgi:hypothetical protein
LSANFLPPEFFLFLIESLKLLLYDLGEVIVLLLFLPDLCFLLLLLPDLVELKDISVVFFLEEHQLFIFQLVLPQPSHKAHSILFIYIPI